MFNENQINAYKNICAPNELREKVLASRKNETRFSYPKRLSALAACLLLVLGLSYAVSVNFSSPAFYINGQSLDKNAVVVSDGSAAMMARAMPSVNAKLEMKLKRDSEIHVSDGFINLESEDTTGEFSDRIFASGDVVINWEIPMPDTSRTYQMSVSDKKSDYLITLEFDKNAGVWTACKKSN